LQIIKRFGKKKRDFQFYFGCGPKLSWKLSPAWPADSVSPTPAWPSRGGAAQSATSPFTLAAGPADSALPPVRPPWPSSSSCRPPNRSHLPPGHRAKATTPGRKSSLRLSSRESASDQNRMCIEIESASSTSSREKIPIKGVAPDQFLIEPKRATLVTAAAIAKSKRGRPSSTFQSRRIPRAPLICPAPQFDRRTVVGRHHWLPWNREGHTNVTLHRWLPKLCELPGENPLAILSILDPSRPQTISGRTSRAELRRARAERP
jgi:hypothetical protein